MTWALPDDAEARLALALHYPYADPGFSYLLTAGEARPLDDAVSPSLFAGRHAVVAHGSNRAPQQLLRKFGGRATLPVTYGWLRGYDVVYGAHVARYGAVTSTLIGVALCAARIALTWLDGAQLRAMHASERMNYTYGLLPPSAFEPEIGPRPERLGVYVGNKGALLLDDAPVGLALVEARRRPHRALAQLALQERLHRERGEALSLREAVLARIEDAERRAAFAAGLRAAGLEGLAGFRPVMRLDSSLS